MSGKVANRPFRIADDVGYQVFVMDTATNIGGKNKKRKIRIYS